MAKIMSVFLSNDKSQSFGRCEMVFHMLSSVVALALVDGMPDIKEIEINEFDDVDFATIPCNLK